MGASVFFALVGVGGGVGDGSMYLTLVVGIIVVYD